MVLGNSGMIALAGLLVWQFVLLKQAWKCRRKETRAAMVSIVAIIAIVFMFDSSFLSPPPTGAIIACLALAACYSQADPSSPARGKLFRGMQNPGRRPPRLMPAAHP
jgi:O-antigen ligase